MRMYYFGCIGQAGHYLWDHNLQSVRKNYRDILPWNGIDGTLCPQKNQVNGIVNIHYKDGWTAAAFWDRSIDSRPGSNSVFFYEDLLGFDLMIEEFKTHFPKIFKRFDFKLIEFTPPADGT